MATRHPGNYVGGDWSEIEDVQTLALIHGVAQGAGELEAKLAAARTPAPPPQAGVTDILTATERLLAKRKGRS